MPQLLVPDFHLPRQRFVSLIPSACVQAYSALSISRTSRLATDHTIWPDGTRNCVDQRKKNFPVLYDRPRSHQRRPWARVARVAPMFWRSGECRNNDLAPETIQQSWKTLLGSWRSEQFQMLLGIIFYATSF